MAQEKTAAQKASRSADVPRASGVAQASRLHPEKESRRDACGTRLPASDTEESRRDACGTESACDTTEAQNGWHDRGYLPHLKQAGGTYFVTFRLADTLPKKVVDQYRQERAYIVQQAEAQGRELTSAEKARLAELFTERIESYLDAGHGKCWLRKPEIGGLVAGALRHFDGNRYTLHAWVVMPNHVHAVLTPHDGHSLSKILQSWKSFAAHEAKKVAQTSRLQIPSRRPFWQRESYDHLVRDNADFARVCEYTVRNPVVAGLCAKPEDWAYGSAAGSARTG